MGREPPRGAPHPFNHSLPSIMTYMGKGAPEWGRRGLSKSRLQAPASTIVYRWTTVLCPLIFDPCPWLGRFLGPVCDGRLPTRSGTCGLPAPTGTPGSMLALQGWPGSRSALSWCLLGSFAFLLGLTLLTPH